MHTDKGKARMLFQNNKRLHHLRQSKHEFQSIHTYRAKIILKIKGVIYVIWKLSKETSIFLPQELWLKNLMIKLIIFLVQGAWM